MMWEFAFEKDNERIEFNDISAPSICLSKRYAYVRLETMLKERPESERQGWRLVKQEPIFPPWIPPE